jgi:hypothetical protein
VSIFCSILRKTGGCDINYVASFFLEVTMLYNILMGQACFWIKTPISGACSRLDLNKILKSSCRQKILKALSGSREVNIMKLVRIVNSTYNEVDRNLRVLEGEQIITQKYLGRARLIWLNWENKKTIVLLKSIKILETPINNKQPNTRMEQNVKPYEQNNHLCH